MLYDFPLDLTTRNSNSIIAKNIKPNSKVLEFGCANGRLTKYMKQELSCSITIVEFDIAAGIEAAQYADENCAYLGEDIDKGDWSDYMYDSRFDYIIFADVLEHLKDPTSALAYSAQLLNPNGCIWISIPNIAHNAVLIDLLQNKFEYKDLGLLDRTHLRFFTESSLRKLIDDCGLKVIQEENLFNQVRFAEFNNSYDELPIEVSIFLKNRPNGELYQFVWKLIKK